MRKKEILAVFICISLTIGVIGVVMTTGNKQHPDLLNNRVVEGIALHKEEEQEALGPAIQKLRIDLEHRTFLESQKNTEEIERLELDDLEEEVELEEFEHDETVPSVTNEQDVGGNGGQGVGHTGEKGPQKKDTPKPAKKPTTPNGKNPSESNQGKDGIKEPVEIDKGKGEQEKPSENPEKPVEEDGNKEEPPEEDGPKDDVDDDKENDHGDKPDDGEE